MERRLIWDVEKITIFLGLAIVGLGFSNIIGSVEISPALVTGISLSGLCLTLADFLSKTYSNQDNKFLLFIDNSLYTLATMSILVYPNSKFATSFDKDILDSISTTASLVALGFVIVTIGFSNKKAMLTRDKKRLEQMLEILENAQKVSQSEAEQNEKTLKLLTDMSMEIAELEKEVHELKSNTVKSPV